jgi:hypothetical protein
MSKSYIISLVGCCDETKFFMELNDTEKALVEKLSELSTKFSEYDCMPVLKLTDTLTSK